MVCGVCFNEGIEEATHTQHDAVDGLRFESAYTSAAVQLYHIKAAANRYIIQ